MTKRIDRENHIQLKESVNVKTGPVSVTKKHLTINARLSELYINFAPCLSKRLRAMYGDGPPDPDDVTQTAFNNLLQRKDIDDIQDLKSYLFQSARNLFFTLVRKENLMNPKKSSEPQDVLLHLTDDSDPERVSIAQEHIALLKIAIDGMPHKRRQAFMLNRFKGLNITQVASHLGISRATASEHIAKATLELNNVIRPNENRDENKTLDKEKR
ncbi:MAG: sigma-70 family RNA polymerase sigma factor [Pseudomonadota bacterium]